MLENIFLALQTYEEQDFIKKVIFGFFNEFESLFNLNKRSKGMNRVYGIIGIKSKMANWNRFYRSSKIYK